MTVNADADTRYSFTPQFLCGAAIFVRRAHAIEDTATNDISDELRTEHRACVVGAVTQSAAALDAQVFEVVMHGPGAHMGSNGTDFHARDLLLPNFQTIKGMRPLLTKYEFVLSLLGKPTLDKQSREYGDAKNLNKLRNAIMHYKSRWSAEIDIEKGDGKLFAQLKELGFDKPRFVSSIQPFFPYQCLSASIASWAVITAVGFIGAFYLKLGVPTPLGAYSSRLKVPITTARRPSDPSTSI